MRGLDDRVFEVHVTGWAYDETTFQPIEYEFDSYYVFWSDGTFIDPAFPDPAGRMCMWVRRSCVGLDHR